MAGAGIGGGGGSLGADIATAEIQDGAVTLAKMADLAQDLFIGRTTASTGVPETATITTAARTVLDDATVAAMVDTLGGTAAQGTGAIVRATSPTLTTPALGTPASGNLASCTGFQDQVINTRRRVYRPTGDALATFACVANTAYWVYMGYTTEAVTPKYVELYQTVLGTVSQAAEVCLASTPLAPNKSNQTLTKIAADGTIDDLTANNTIMKRNTSALATQVAAGTHLWVGFRMDMGGTEVSAVGLGFDFGQGYVLSTAAAGVLTDAGPWTGSIITAATAAIAPYLSMTLD